MQNIRTRINMDKLRVVILTSTLGFIRQKDMDAGGMNTSDDNISINIFSMKSVKRIVTTLFALFVYVLLVRVMASIGQM
jgi:hypothetical protein